MRFLFRNSAVAASELDVIAVAIVAIKTGDAVFCESNLLVKSGCGAGSGVEEGEEVEKSSLDASVLCGSDKVVEFSDDEVEFSMVVGEGPAAAKLVFPTKYFKR